jgi:uncharacterized protein YecT (DUF1311 family)
VALGVVCAASWTTVGAALPLCAAARGDAAKAACEKAEIARLDAELNRAYAAAMKASRRPQALRQEQRAWLWGRLAGKVDADVENDARDYAERIAVLRLRADDPSLDLHDALLGRYGRMERACFFSQRSKDGMECEGRAPSTMTVLPVDASRARLIVDTLFFNGHSCSFDAIGTWEGNTLRFREEGYVDGAVKPGACKLTVTFPGGTLVSLDEDGGCRMACGARGSLSKREGDPKWPVSAGELRARAK